MHASHIFWQPVPGIGGGGFFAGGTVFDFRLTTLAALLAAGLSNAQATTNPPGTVVGPSGNVQYGAHNLQVWSDDWTQSVYGLVGATATANSITIGASPLTAYSYKQAGALTVGQTYTARLRISGPAGRVVALRARDGGTLNTFASITLTGVPTVYTLTFVPTSTSGIAYGLDNRSPYNAGGAGTLQAGDVVNIDQVGLVYGTVDTGYVPTTTTAVYAPRLTCDRGATQNLAVWSEDLTNGVYTGSASIGDTITSVATGRALQKLYENGTVTQRWQRGQSITVAAGATVRVDVAAGERKRMALREGSQTGAMVLFDASTGTIIATASCTAWARPLGSGQYTVYMTPTGLTAGAKVFTVETMLDTDAAWAAGGHAGVAGSGIYVGNFAAANVSGEFAYLRTFGSAPLYSAGTPTAQNLLPNGVPSAANGWNASLIGTAGSVHTPSASSGTHYLQYTSIGGVPGTVVTLAFRAKANGYSRINVGINGVGSATFFLSNGTASAGLLRSTIEADGTGYYLCRASWVANGTAAALYILDNASNFTYVGDGTSGVDIPQAWMYEGTADLPYTATTGTPVSVYPQRAMKREPQRANLALWSKDFTQATWQKFGATVTGDFSGTADRVQLTAAAGNRIVQDIALTAQTYTISCTIQGNGTSGTVRLQGQTALGVDAFQDAAYTPVRQRFTFSFTSTAAFTASIGIRVDSANSAADLIVEDFQIEAGAWATTPIPTTTAAVTRSADLIRPGTVITDGPMTVLMQARADKAASGANQCIVGRSGGFASVINAAGLGGTNDGTQATSASPTLADGVSFRLATRWSAAGQGASANGSAVNTAAFDGSMGSGTAGIGDNGAGAFDFSGDIEFVGVVGQAATDAQLQQLSAGTLQ